MYLISDHSVRKYSHSSDITYIMNKFILIGLTICLIAVSTEAYEDSTGDYLAHDDHTDDYVAHDDHTDDVMAAATDAVAMLSGNGATVDPEEAEEASEEASEQVEEYWDEYGYEQAMAA